MAEEDATYRERAEALAVENARLRAALTALTEQAASWLAQYTDDDGSMWNVGWVGGSAREMRGAVEQSRAALKE